MLSVTEIAKQELKNMLLEGASDPQIGLRLALRPDGQLGLSLDSAGEGDQVIEHEESKILIVEPELAAILKGATIDVREDAEGRKLFLSKE